MWHQRGGLRGCTDHEGAGVAAEVVCRGDQSSFSRLSSTGQRTSVAALGREDYKHPILVSKAVLVSVCAGAGSLNTVISILASPKIC